MNTQEIIEGNKLIAEFMGLDYTEIYHMCTNELYDLGHRNPDFINNEINWRCFHSSWDWLMSVVEKIESYAKKNINCEFKKYFYESSETIFDIRLSPSKKEKVWLLCIEFIKWYNENKLCKNN